MAAPSFRVLCGKMGNENLDQHTVCASERCRRERLARATQTNLSSRAQSRDLVSPGRLAHPISPSPSQRVPHLSAFSAERWETSRRGSPKTQVVRPHDAAWESYWARAGRLTLTTV